MPWGIHAGKKMEDVPDSYLLFLYDSKKVRSGPVFEYIVDNLDAIKENAKRN
nr:MAG TPA: Putative quorum-sensing-regulated virulence factor [Crassvirales sp.]